MNKKILNYCIPLLIVITGFSGIIFPWLFEGQIYIYLPIALFLVFASKLINYILVDDSSDKDDYYSANLSLLVCLYCAIVGKETVTENYPLITMVWVGLLSIVKLKKIDYLHDRKDKRLTIFLSTSVLFLLTGLFTSLALFFHAQSASIYIGYLLIIYGSSCMLDEYSIEFFKTKKRTK